MGRFTPHYTPEQRDAIARAMLGDFGRPMTAPQAVDAASAGTLPIPGLAPFTMPAKSAYTYRDDLAERREEDRRRASPSQSKRERVEALLERELQRLEAKDAMNAQDRDAMRQIIRTQNELDRMPRIAARKPAPDAMHTSSEPRAASFISDLAAQEEREATGEGEDAEPTGEAASPTADRHKEQDAIPVR